MIKTLDTGDIFVLTSEMDNKIKQLSVNYHQHKAGGL